MGTYLSNTLIMQGGLSPVYPRYLTEQPTPLSWKKNADNSKLHPNEKRMIQAQPSCTDLSTLRSS